MTALPAGAAPSEPLTPFGSFTVARSRFRGQRGRLASTASARRIFRAKFRAQGEFTLGAGSDGIDFTTDTIRISAGDFVQEITPAEWEPLLDGGVRFTSRSLNRLRRVVIHRTNTGFTYLVAGSRLLIDEADLFTLQMGADIGQINLTTGETLDPLARSRTLRRAAALAETTAATKAVVVGQVVSDQDAEGLSSVRASIACPDGRCGTLSRLGRFELNATPGVQELVLDGTDEGYTSLRRDVVVRDGANDIGIVRLPKLDTAAAVTISAGVQASATTITASSGPNASLTIPAGATVTFPADLTSPQAVSLVPASLDALPAPFPTNAAGPFVFTAQPDRTTIAPCADLVLDNPYLGLGDGTPVPIYGFNHATAQMALLGTGTVQNGGSEIAAPGVLCELTYVYPACASAATEVVGRVVRNGDPVSGMPVSVRGAQTTTFDPPADLNGDLIEENFRLPAVAAGCAGGTLTGVAFTNQAANLLNGTSVVVPAVPGGMTDLGEIVLPYLPCGRALQQFEPMFDDPKAIAVAADGSVYVSDWDNYRIRKLDPNGTPLVDFNYYERRDQEFPVFYPEGVAVDPSGNVYVLDGAPNYWVVKFDANGKFLKKFGRLGTDPGEFRSPTGIAVDASGNVYVGEGSRVQKFDANGKLVPDWRIDTGSRGLAIDADGNLFLLLTTASLGPGGWVYAGEVREFDPAGNLLVQWSLAERTRPIAGIAVGPSGEVYISDFGQIYKYDNAGTLLATIDLTLLYANEYNRAFQRLAVDPAGNVYVTDLILDAVLKFDANGTFLDAFGTYPGQDFPGVAADRDGTVRVYTYGRMFRFNPAGQRIGWNEEPEYASWTPRDWERNEYTVTADARIQKRNPSGSVVAEWGGLGDADDQFHGIWDLVVDAPGNVYVSDFGDDEDPNYIKKFATDGTFLLKWPAYLYGDLALDARSNVYGFRAGFGRFEMGSFDSEGRARWQYYADIWTGPITVREDGNVFVADQTHNRIVIFGENGKIRQTWSKSGPPTFGGQFRLPYSLALDTRGNAYVADLGYPIGRIQKFACP